MNIGSTIRLLSGNRMPIMGLGTWQLTRDTSGTITSALQMGYPMIDTSGDYGTQSGIARGIQHSGVGRHDFYLVTKIEETDDAYLAVQENLRQLQLGYADLILIHRPPRQGVGERLWLDLIRARDDGLTRDIGVSNYSEEQIQALIDLTSEVPSVNQIEWSPLGWSRYMLEFCSAHRIVIQAYSPLTRGRRLHEQLLEEIGDEHSRTPAQVLLRWNIQKGTVPIVKANQETHLEEDMDIFDFELSADDMRRLDNMNENYSALSRKPIYKQQTSLAFSRHM